MQLHHGDCLDILKQVPDGSVDMILTDPPYGTIKGMELDGWESGKVVWDVCIDHDLLMAEYNRVLRMNGALVLFSQDPYTIKLITETHGNLPFSYRYIWLKDHFANSLLAKKAPVKYTEDVCVFFKKYDTLAQHPLRGYAKRIMDFIGKDKQLLFKEMGHQGICHFYRFNSMQFGLCTESTYEQLIGQYGINNMDGFKSYSELKEIDNRFARRFILPKNKKFKSNVLQYKKDYTGLHPTQKPVKLIEDLVSTYTHEGDTVVDSCMGSGTTGVACKNLNRNFIGIELDKDYFEIARQRIYGQTSLTEGA